MKPSDKIEEIRQELWSKSHIGDNAHSELKRKVDSIIQYLDEEWEKNHKSEQFNKDFAVHDATSKLQ